MKNFIARQGILFSVISLFVLLFAPAHVAADMYVGLEMGLIEQESMDIQGSDNDVPTRCDQLLSSLSGSNTGFIDLTQSSLMGDCRRGQDTWETSNDVNLGVLAGFQIGYKFGRNWRTEFEYIYRVHGGGDDEAIVEIGGNKEAELQAADQGLTGMSSDIYLANIYYDFKDGSKVTPYLGVGAGFAQMDLEYEAVFARNANPNFLGPTTPPAAAGTTTYANETFRDTVFVWQVVAGFDYAIDKNWSVGLKARYMEFDDIEENHPWDRLRSHDSAIATEAHANSIGIDPTVEYDIDVEDITAWAIGANLKYHF